ncbi:unnamed protein product, partial [Linum tenue]
EAHRIKSFYNSRAQPNPIDYRSLDAYRQHSLRRRVSKEDTKEKHKVSERDRRSRMNSMYSDLRTILPNIIKQKNKASVLEETIRQLKQLKSTAFELNAICGGGSDCLYPGGDDDDSVVSIEDKEGKGEQQQQQVVKVMLSCEDRRKLMEDVGKAVRTVKAKVLRAEMVIMGGRMKCVLWVEEMEGYKGKCMLEMALNAAARGHVQ